MWLERISGATPDVIDLADAKAHLRLLDDDTDGEVQKAIKAASAFLDVDEDGFGGLGFPLVAQQWVTIGTGFRPDVLRLPFRRVSAIDEVGYIDRDGANQVVAPENYIQTRRGRDVFVTLLPGLSWPSVADRPDAVRVTFTAGFASVADVPDDIKAAARLLVGHFFENRLAAVEGTISTEVKLGVDRLLTRYLQFIG